MKILDAKVCWYTQYDISPQFEVLMSDIPDKSRFRYEEKSGLYVAELNGVFSFYYYPKPSDGYGGRHFPIAMKNGTTILLRGPWYSRAACVNKLGFGPCDDVAYTDKPSDLERGFTLFFDYALSLDLLKQCAKMAGCHLVKIVNSIPRSVNLDKHQGFVRKCLGNKKDISCHLDVKVPINTEFHFSPSMSPDNLVKKTK